MSHNQSIAQDVISVKGESWGGSPLADYPILVCTLQRGWFVLDLNKEEPDYSTDYIPFQGEPVYSGDPAEYDYDLEQVMR